MPGEGWDFYNSTLEGTSSRGHASGYFNAFAIDSFYQLGGFTAEKFIDEIDEFRANPKNADRKVLILDALGQGAAFVGIADEIVATTLTPNPVPQSGVVEFNGDALSEEVSKRVFSHIERRIEAGGALRASFFRPVAGLTTHRFNMYVYHILYERLRKIYELTDEGGRIFIQTFGDHHDIGMLEELLSNWKIRSIVTADSFPSHNRILITKNSAVCPSLPTIKQVALERPRFIETLLSLNDMRHDKIVTS